LFKLHRYDEALIALNNSQFNNDLEKAALLILMGAESDAQMILNCFIVRFFEYFVVRMG